MKNNKHIYEDEYVCQQMKNVGEYDFSTSEDCGNSYYNKKEIIEFVKEIKKRIELIRCVEDYEIDYRYYYEEKIYINSVGSHKRYTFPNCSLVVGYTISGYEGMFRGYNIGNKTWKQLISEIEVQIKKDEVYANEAIIIPKGKYRCVFSPELTGILVHECLGHLSEADVAMCIQNLNEWVLGKK